MNTESRNPKSNELSSLSSLEILQLMDEEEQTVVKAVRNAQIEIERAAKVVCETFLNNEKIVLVGAGTSGRICGLEAAELPPTFGVDRNQFVALIAGGNFMHSVEGAEDNIVAAKRDFESIENVGCVIGVSASGSAPYVLEIMEYAMDAPKIGISNNIDSLLLTKVDVPIFLNTGPEILTGSTRLKAGTSQKMTLNRISLCAMVLAGRVSGNLMAYMTPVNEKLKKRAINIVSISLGISHQDALEKLELNEWSIPRSIGYEP